MGKVCIFKIQIIKRGDKVKKEEKKEKKYPYIWRGLRIIDGVEYERFRELCHASYSNPNREINLFIHRSVQAGKIFGSE